MSTLPPDQQVQLQVAYMSEITRQMWTLEDKVKSLIRLATYLLGATGFYLCWNHRTCLLDGQYVGKVRNDGLRFR